MFDTDISFEDAVKSEEALQAYSENPGFQEQMEIIRKTQTSLDIFEDRDSEESLVRSFRNLMEANGADRDYLDEVLSGPKAADHVAVVVFAANFDS